MWRNDWVEYLRNLCNILKLGNVLKLGDILKLGIVLKLGDILKLGIIILKLSKCFKIILKF